MQRNKKECGNFFQLIIFYNYSSKRIHLNAKILWISILLLSKKPQRGCSHKHLVAGKITASIINLTKAKNVTDVPCSIFLKILWKGDLLTDSRLSLRFYMLSKLQPHTIYVYILYILYMPYTTALYYICPSL